MTSDMRQQAELVLMKKRLALGLRDNKSCLGRGEKFSVAKARGGMEVAVRGGTNQKQLTCC